MNLEQAIAVPDEAFLEALTKKPVRRDLDGLGEMHAIYTSKAKRATLVGVVSPERWAALMEQRLKIVELEGESSEAGEVFDTVGAGDGPRRKRLEARRQQLLDQLAKVEAKLA